MAKNTIFAAIGGALAGLGSSYLINRRSALHEPSWAKEVRERINIVRGKTLLLWEFIGTGGGGSEVYFESSNYANWRPCLNVDGKNVRDHDAAIEIWLSKDKSTITIEVYHVAGVVVYWDAVAVDPQESCLTKFVI